MLNAVAGTTRTISDDVMPRTTPAGGERRIAGRLPTLAAGLGLLAAVVIAYWPALTGSFLWDDNAHVTKPELRSWAGLGRIWSEVGATQQYYPLLHTAFWAEHRLWGDAVVGYHLTNILLHVVAAWLVVAIVRRLPIGTPGPSPSLRTGGAGDERRERQTGVAWLAGALFALHPVCVESVAWISEQKNTLSAVFYLGAALAYLGFDETRRKSQYGLALGLFLLALLSKTVTATLPAALVVILWWRRGRLGWGRDVVPLLPWFAVGAAVGLLSAGVERRFIGAVGADFALSLTERGLVAGRVIWFYLGKFLWPASLSFVYPRWQVGAAALWQYAYPAGALALITGLGWTARRRGGPGVRATTAGFLFYASTLFPVLGFLNVYPFIYSYVADHFQYLACLGAIVPLAAMLPPMTDALPAARWRAVLGCALLGGLGTLTWQQSHVYRDAETLFRATLTRNPASWMAHNNLGDVLANTPDRLSEAEAEFTAAIRLKPLSGAIHYNLANALAKIPGRLPEAIAEYQSALRLKPDFPEAHNNLGEAWSRIPGHATDAIAEYQAALRGRPGDAVAHNNLGNALAGITGRSPEAIREYQAALRFKPGYAEAHNNLGNLLGQIPGRMPEAIAEYETALRLRPDFVEAHFNLGNALARGLDRLAEAAAQYEAALRLDPALAEAHFNLGRVLLRIPGRSGEARAHFQRALEIQPDFAPARQILEALPPVSPGIRGRG